jgi:arsenate reductase-like glutaredoxin family protein
MTLYGIPNCDTVKKASAWLARLFADPIQLIEAGLNAK